MAVEIKLWAIPIIAFLITVLVGSILRRIIFNMLSKWAKSSKARIDDIMISGLRYPSVIWFVMLGLYAAVIFSVLPENIVLIIEKTLLVLGVVSVTMAVADIAGQIVKTYADRLDSTLPMTSLTQNFTRIIVFIVGTLILLNTMGVSITPILASLGIGGLAVALALQDTLSNLFAGFHILIAKQIRIGDYVKLDSGDEGYVADINWRTTKIRALPNHMILVPNAKLSQAIVTNYYMPDKEIAVLIQIGVHYNSDLKKVEAVTNEVSREVLRRVSGGVAEFDPFIRYHTFSDFSINFTVILRAREFVDQHLIKHEFIKALHERYAKEGISIPYPIQAVNYDQEKAYVHLRGKSDD